MIDRDGYRPNVGIILANDDGKVLWARRLGQSAWQFPQGGIKRHETPEQALYRELYEELGLEAQSVDVIGSTQDWLRYDLPKRYVRRHSHPLCVGQKQVWFLLKFLDQDSAFRLNTSPKPEFDSWKWVDYWHPTREVIAFKRNVYKLALRELAPLFYANFSAQGRGGRGPWSYESRSGRGH